MSPAQLTDQGRNSPSVPTWRRLTVRHLFLLAPWVGLVIAAHRPLRDNSFLWHVRAGSLQSESGEVLTSDPFSFTVGGDTWRTQSWLAELLYGWLEDSSDLAFVPWLILVGGFLTLAFTGISAYRRAGRLFPVVVGLIATVWLGFAYLSPRPVLFSYVLLALTVLLLDLRKARWALPLVIWLWASLHGSFVLGIGLIALEGLRTGRRTRIIDAGVSLVAASFTAHGLAIWAILITFLQSGAALEFITEWAPPDLLGLASLPYLFVLAGLVIAAARGRISPRDLWVPLPFALFGLTTARALLPAVLVVLPWSLLAWPSQPETDMGSVRPALATLNWAVAASIVVIPLAMTQLDAGLRFAGLSEERFPVQAALRLSEGPAFHDDVAGGYLIFAHWPQRTVYIDDRAELYGADFYEEFSSARSAKPGWEKTLADRRIDQALLRVTDPLASALRLAGWTETYRDDNFVVFAR